MTPTRRHALMIDASRCIGCHSCAVACKMEHELPAGPRTVKVIQIGPLEADGAPLMRYETVTCFHCDRPACVSACPTGAMQKRPDGGKIAKCDGCRERVDRGLWPACALKCPTGCLSYGAPIRVVQDLRMREAVTIARSIAVR